MDDWAEVGGVPQLNESFVAGAKHCEPSYRARQLEEERARARERSLLYQAELNEGQEEARRAQRGRRRAQHQGRPSSTSPGQIRRRTIVGAVMTVAVIAASAYLPSHLSSEHAPLVPLIASPITTCPAKLYPAGAEYRFERCANGRPLGWPRCSALTVSINATDAPGTWRSDTSAAINMLSAATGLRIRTVTAGGANIAIAWSSTLTQSGTSGADKLGVTHSEFQSSPVGSRIRAANIQIASRLNGGAGPNGELPVLLHELGHAVGLGHYGGTEVMNPVDRGYSAYQPGDLAGLDQLYQPRSCDR